MRRTKEDAAITREQLLSKALKVFSEKGYNAATLEDIAKEAEVTRGAIYWHFKNKAELYNTLITEYSKVGSNIMHQSIKEGGSLTDILKRVFIRQLTAIQENQELRQLMELQFFKTGLSEELEQGRIKQFESVKSLVDMLSGIMGQGMEQGLLRADMNPSDVARSYLAFQNGLIHLWLTGPDTFDLKAGAELFSDILFSGIGSSK